MVGLEAIALFCNLSPGELQALRLITQERQFAAGSEIFREGAPGDGVYFVNEGLVEISGLVGGNTRQVFSQLGPGEIFGEMAVIEQLPRSAIGSANLTSGTCASWCKPKAWRSSDALRRPSSMI